MTDVLEERFRWVHRKKNPPPGATIAIKAQRGTEWHTDHDCPKLANTSSVRIYPLEAAMRLSSFFASPCDYCVLPEEQLREVLREHEPGISLIGEFLRG